MRYLKKIRFLLPMLCLMVLLSGCRDSGSGVSNDTGVNESEISKEPQTDDPERDKMDAGDTLPSEEIIVFSQKSNVNLVEGESNNRIVVDQNIREMEISLTVYLENGTFRTIKYPMATEMDFTIFETAYLQYDNKESIVLEIVNGTSNYGGAEYHILHVEKDSHGFEIVEDATVLGEQPLTDDRYVYSLIEFVGNVSETSVEDLITTIHGKPAVRFVDWDSGRKEGETYYLYYDKEWKVEGGDTEDVAAAKTISVAGLWDRESAAKLSPEDAVVIVELIKGCSWAEVNTILGEYIALGVSAANAQEKDITDTYIVDATVKGANIRFGEGTSVSIETEYYGRASGSTY